MQAIHKSRLETTRTDAQCPACPVFTPTDEEFSDPLAFLDSIRAVAETYSLLRKRSIPCWPPAFFGFFPASWPLQSAHFARVSPQQRTASTTVWIWTVKPGLSNQAITDGLRALAASGCVEAALTCRLLSTPPKAANQFGTCCDIPLPGQEALFPHAQLPRPVAVAFDFLQSSSLSAQALYCLVGLDASLEPVIWYWGDSFTVLERGLKHIGGGGSKMFSIRLKEGKVDYFCFVDVFDMGDIDRSIIIEAQGTVPDSRLLRLPDGAPSGLAIINSGLVVLFGSAAELVGISMGTLLVPSEQLGNLSPDAYATGGAGCSDLETAKVEFVLDSRPTAAALRAALREFTLDRSCG